MGEIRFWKRHLPQRGEEMPNSSSRKIAIALTEGSAKFSLSVNGCFRHLRDLKDLGADSVSPGTDDPIFARSVRNVNQNIVPRSSHQKRAQIRLAACYDHVFAVTADILGREGLKTGTSLLVGLANQHRVGAVWQDRLGMK